MLRDVGRDWDALFDYRGLFWRRPYLTAVLATMMLSLAGIPLTAGFIGKFYVIAAGVESQQWWLLGTLIVGSAIAVFYYLRVMVAMFLVEPSLQRRDAPLNWAQRAGGIMLLAVGGLTRLLGGFPPPRSKRKLKPFLVKQTGGKIGCEFDPRRANAPAKKAAAKKATA